MIYSTSYVKVPAMVHFRRWYNMIQNIILLLMLCAGDDSMCFRIKWFNFFLCAGVITKVAIQCPPHPASVNTMLIAINSFASSLAIYKIARQQLGEILSAFEFLDQEAMQLALTHLPGLQNPFPELHNMYILVETSGAVPRLKRIRKSIHYVKS